MIILVILVSALFPSTAEAYVDPGTGSMIFQILVATFVGALFYFRKFVSQIWTFSKNIVATLYRKTDS